MTKSTIIIQVETIIRNNEPFGIIDAVKRTVQYDDEEVYNSTVAIKQYNIESSPLRDLERWLAGQEQPQGCSNISRNGGNRVHLLGHRWLERFNFVKKFFNLLFEKLFLSREAASVKRIKRLCSELQRQMSSPAI